MKGSRGCLLEPHTQPGPPGLSWLLLSQHHLLVRSGFVLYLSPPAEDRLLRAAPSTAGREAALSRATVPLQAGLVWRKRTRGQSRCSQNPSINVGERNPGSNVCQFPIPQDEIKIRNRGPIAKDSIRESARCWPSPVGGERPVPTCAQAPGSPPRKTR